MKEILIDKKVTPLSKVSSRALGELISVVQHRLSPTGDYREIADAIRKEFKVDVTEDDVVRYFTPQICEIESELLYTQYGYDRKI